jgi:hypothetical protein
MQMTTTDNLTDAHIRAARPGRCSVHNKLEALLNLIPHNSDPSMVCDLSAPRMRCSQAAGADNKCGC